jgi:microcystin degradation protein MlrC
VGPDLPVIASLDFHANVSPLMVEQASALIAYRTYPHTDMAQSGEHALRLIHDVRDWPLVARLRQLPFLIPLTSQCTLVPPMNSLMAAVTQLETTPLRAVNFTPGFPASDVAECGPAVSAYGEDTQAVERAVQQIADLASECENEFQLQILSIEAALHEIARTPVVTGRPIILADTQDNPGGGGGSDTTSLLKALIAQHVEQALVGLIYDPEVAARAHEAGIGMQIDAALGARADARGESPLNARFTVVALGDGKFTATGPFYAGARMDLGPMALLRIDNVYIAVSSRRQQAADRAMFHHLHVDPRDFAVVALKSSVHFRADFDAIANRILVVEAPGANVADPALLPFTKLRRGMRMPTRAVWPSVAPI